MITQACVEGKASSGGEDERPSARGAVDIAHVRNNQVLHRSIDMAVPRRIAPST
jgi:hypothetical protein